jgi:AraC-like DNA-binding protein
MKSNSESSSGEKKPTAKIFPFGGSKYSQRNDSRQNKNAKYSLSDYFVHADSAADWRIDTKSASSSCIIRFSGKSQQVFKHSWPQIRQDGSDRVVLWLVKRGTLYICNERGNSVAGSGHFAIAKSISPFTVECRPDPESIHDSFCLIVSTHIFRRIFPLSVNAGLVIFEEREFHIAESILKYVFEASIRPGDHLEQILIDGALTVMAEAIKRHQSHAQVHPSLPEVHLKNILNFIDAHLSMPQLSASMAAEACGISTRYLSHLLQKNGTPFSSFVWERRLKAANEWLSSTRSSEISIAEIALRTGFKSSSHFSRLFKHAFKKSPRELRECALEIERCGILENV